MLELACLLFPTLGQIFRSRHDLVLENLLPPRRRGTSPLLWASLACFVLALQGLMDLVARGGTVVLESGSLRADVLVRGDKVARLVRHGSVGAGRARVIDASGALVLPGGLDAHTHVGISFGEFRPRGLRCGVGGWCGTALGADERSPAVTHRRVGRQSPRKRSVPSRPSSIRT
jgi:hypothetical protein